MQTIAMVHEGLSQTADEVVDFDKVIANLLRMAVDLATMKDQHIDQFLLARRTFAMPTALRAIAVTDAVAPMMPRTRPETRNAKPFRPRFIIPYLHCFVT